MSDDVVFALPETCGVHRDDGVLCDDVAVLVVIFRTDEGDSIIATCKAHMMRVSGVIDALVRNTILGDPDAETISPDA